MYFYEYQHIERKKEREGGLSKGKRELQRDRKTGREIDRHTKIERQTSRETGRQKDRETDRQK